MNENQPQANAQALQILVIADDKAGHQNQSLGLAQAIGRHVAVVITQAAPLTKLDIGQSLALQQAPPPWQGIPRPDIAICTGSGTHLSLLAVTRIFPECFTTLLCTSLLPSSLFDLNVVPEHDNHRPGSNIIFTKGVLNKVVPGEQKEVNYGLMLIGGESKHYRWSDHQLIEQIRSVCNQTPETHWHITNSRRTPQRFNELLQKQLPHLDFHPWQETPSGWLPKQLARAEKIWVTPDSVSMVYESLTSGNTVYLFRLKSRRTRVARGIEALRDKETGDLRKRQIIEPSATSPLWEAERIAHIILQKLGIQARH